MKRYFENKQLTLNLIPCTIRDDAESNRETNTRERVGSGTHALQII